IDAAARASAAGLAGATVAADRLVVAQRTIGDGQDSAGRVEDAAAPGLTTRAAESLVGRQGAVGDGQGAGVVDRAAVLGWSVGDRQAVEDGGDAAADLEDPAGVRAADGQPVGARTGDQQAVRDVKLTADQGDGALETGGEVDDVNARLSVGVQDRLPQRAGAAVGKVGPADDPGQGPG